MNDQVQQLEYLATTFRKAQQIVVITGAGVSVASGINPFRKSTQAIWEKNITDKGTLAYFKESPVDSWTWYLDRFEGLADKRANLTHHALKDLENWSKSNGQNFTLITQNIDGLHRQAHSKELIEIHGRADFSRCSAVGCLNGAPHGHLMNDTLDFSRFMLTKSESDIPHCPLCNSLLRPHVLWFDERYDDHKDYQFERAYNALSQADLTIAIGTSFSVGITELALLMAERNHSPIWGIDLMVDDDIPLDHWLLGQAEHLIPQLCQTIVNCTDHSI